MIRAIKVTLASMFLLLAFFSCRTVKKNTSQADYRSDVKTVSTYVQNERKTSYDTTVPIPAMIEPLEGYLTYDPVDGDSVGTLNLYSAHSSVNVKFNSKTRSAKGAVKSQGYSVPVKATTEEKQTTGAVDKHEQTSIATRRDESKKSGMNIWPIAIIAVIIGFLYLLLRWLTRRTS